MAEFNVQGQWNITQGSSTNVAFDIKPPRADGSFVGNASHSDGRVTGGGFGQVRDDHFWFRILWSDRTTEGLYFGAFDPGGRLNGATFDVKNPSSTATWRANKTFSR